MTTDSGRRPAYPGDRDDASSSESPNDSSMETLRELLFGHYRQRIAELEIELDELERRTTDKEALIAMIAPVLGDIIRRKTRDAREEMIEALSPIIGQIITHAVSEAIRNRARITKVWLQTSLKQRVSWHRFQVWIRGIFSIETIPRDRLPSEIAEVFLIHRETGSLLRHISSTPRASRDSEFIREMLTAIRKFAEDAFGQGEEGQSDEVRYGERRILMEAAQHIYLAVVVEGIEPPGFKSAMHERLIEVEHAYQRALLHSNGETPRLVRVREPLSSLITTARPQGKLSPPQQQLLVGALRLLAICLAGACLIGGWAWWVTRYTPSLLPIVEPTPLLTATLSPTPTLATTFTPTPTLMSTSTPMPTFTPLLTLTPR